MYGLAIANAAVVRALTRRGIEVVAVDDTSTAARHELARSLGVELVIAPGAAELDALVRSSSVVVPAPGVPESHAVFAAAAAAGRPLRSEIEIAYRWEQERPGWAEADARRDGDGWEDVDDAVGGRDARGRGRAHGGQRQH